MNPFDSFPKPLLCPQASEPTDLYVFTAFVKTRKGATTFKSVECAPKVIFDPDGFDVVEVQS